MMFFNVTIFFLICLLATESHTRIVDLRDDHYNSQYGYPGIKLRLTRKGAEHVKRMGVKLLNEQLAQLRGFRAAHPFTSPTGLSGHVYLSDLQTLQYQPPDTSAISFAAPNQLIFSVVQMGITLLGRFVGVSGPFQVPGQVQGQIAGMQIVLSTAFHTEQTTGQISVRVTNCSTSIQRSQFALEPEGPLSAIVKIFEAQINDLIRDRIPNLLCRGLETIIDRNAPSLFQKLSRVDLTEHFAIFNGSGVIERFIRRFTEGLYIDGRSIFNPTVTTEYFETQQRGELRYNKYPDLSPPFYPDPIPHDGDSDRMLYLYGSHYMLNSLLYNAYQTDRLSLKIDEYTLQEPYRGFMRTSCKASSTNVGSFEGDFLAGVCVGMLIPAIGEHFPSTTTKFLLLPHKLPKIRFVDGVSSMDVRTRILTYVKEFLRNSTNNSDNNSISRDHQVLVSSADGVADIRLGADSTAKRFIGDLKLRKLIVRLHRTAIDGINPESISQLAPLAKTFLGPQLATGFKQGFPFPLKESIRFLEPRLSIRNGFVRLETDFELVEESFRQKVGEAFERIKNFT